MFQVFHCVHFECPGDPQAVGDYESTLPTSPSKASLSDEEGSEANSAPSHCIVASASSSINARAAPAPPLFPAAHQMAGPVLPNLQLPPTQQPGQPAQGMGGQAAMPPAPPRSPSPDGPSQVNLPSP